MPVDLIEVKSNVKITARERGKIVARREGHNIFLNTGREWLAKLINYASFGPDTPETDDRIRYMGAGIGGFRQLVPNSAPQTLPSVLAAYPRTNLQTDDDPTVLTLERSVRVSGTSTVFPYDVSDVWLAQVQAPAIHNTATEVTFTRVFTYDEISYSPYDTVPLSEVGLYTDAANPNIYNNSGITFVAYDTFDTLSKTSAIQIQFDWTIRF